MEMQISLEKDNETIKTFLIYDGDRHDFSYLDMLKKYLSGYKMKEPSFTEIDEEDQNLVKELIKDIDKKANDALALDSFQDFNKE